MRVKTKINHNHLKHMRKTCIETLVETADGLLNDLKQSQTIPFDTGNLQNRSTFVDTSNKNSGKVSIVSDTLYARKLYYHPEYNFQKGKNANAGGKWFEPYISGKKKNFAKNAFARILRGKL